MVFSKSCQAAIKAVAFLVNKNRFEQKISIKDIADYIGENVHTVGKLLQTLVKNEIIKSHKGPHGGFYITHEQLNIPLLRIVEAIDGKYNFNHCVLGLKKCSETHHCSIHTEYIKIRKIAETAILKKTITELN